MTTAKGNVMKGVIDLASQATSKYISLKSEKEKETKKNPPPPPLIKKKRRR